MIQKLAVRSYALEHHLEGMVQTYTQHNQPTFLNRIPKQIKRAYPSCSRRTPMSPINSSCRWDTAASSICKLATSCKS